MPRLLTPEELRLRFPLAEEGTFAAVSDTGVVTFPARSAEEALATAARYRAAPLRPQVQAHDCPRCTDPADPTSHRGSPNCRSGSLASGGYRAHCTCDTCF